MIFCLSRHAPLQFARQVPCQCFSHGNPHLYTCAWVVIPLLPSTGSYTGHRIRSYCPSESDSSCWPRSKPLAATGISQTPFLLMCLLFFRFPHHTRLSLPCAVSQLPVSLIHLPSTDEDKVFFAQKLLSHVPCCVLARALVIALKFT